jgi:carbonic anhydrase
MRRRNGDPGISFIIIGVIVIVAVASYFISNVRRKRRTEAFQRVAEDLGLTFSPQGNEDLATQLGWCELFSRGRDKKILNLMRGSNEGREIAVFDYQYVTGHGKSRRTVCSTVACLRSDGPPIPGFTLRPEGTWDKISNLFGGNDIDFDTHAKFSRSFVLRGENEAAVRKLFAAPVLDYYEQHPGISAEGSNDTLLFYRHRKSVPPEGVTQFLADAFESLSLFRGESRG